MISGIYINIKNVVGIPLSQIGYPPSFTKNLGTDIEAERRARIVVDGKRGANVH